MSKNRNLKYNLFILCITEKWTIIYNGIRLSEIVKNVVENKNFFKKYFYPF